MSPNVYYLSDSITVTCCGHKRKHLSFSVDKTVSPQRWRRLQGWIMLFCWFVTANPFIIDLLLYENWLLKALIIKMILCISFLFLSSCEPPWCWINTCRWRLCPSRGQEWSKAWCVGCLGGATTVWVEVRPPSPWGRSQCPLFQLQGATAASPLTETSQQTWSVLATGLEEKMHARYMGTKAIWPSFTSAKQLLFYHYYLNICEVRCCTLMSNLPHCDKHDHLVFEKPLNPFWNNKFSKVPALVLSVYQIAHCHPLFISSH